MARPRCPDDQDDLFSVPMGPDEYATHLEKLKAASGEYLRLETEWAGVRENYRQRLQTSRAVWARMQEECERKVCRCLPDTNS